MEPQPPSPSLIDLLDQLQDITEPPPVSLLPATAAWAVLAAAALAALVTAALLWHRHRRATAYRRAALADLARLAPALAAGDPAAAGALQTLLRRTALTAYPRADVAALTGDAWAAFLQRTGGTFGPLAPALAAAPYRPVPQDAPPALDSAAALAAARAWIRHHHA